MWSQSSELKDSIKIMSDLFSDTTYITVNKILRMQCSRARANIIKLFRSVIYRFS